MANLFARVKAKGWGGEARVGRRRADALCRRSRATWSSRGPASRSRRRRSTASRCRSTTRPTAACSLAEWLTSPENPYFARSITNRVWANFFGVGLVEKVDDMRVSNPASNEELLDGGRGRAGRHKFDLKALMKAILQSNAYQRSSRPLPGNRGRAPVLLAVLPAADDGRGAARRDRAGHAGADEVRVRSSSPAAPGRRPTSIRWAPGRSSSTTRPSRTTSCRRSAATRGGSSASASGPTSRRSCRCCTSPTATR